MLWIDELMYLVRRGLLTSQSRLRVWPSSGFVFASNVDNEYHFSYKTNDSLNFTHQTSTLKLIAFPILCYKGNLLTQAF